MIGFEEFHLFATRSIPPLRWTSEIEVRRSVSSLYYGLFHRLAIAAAGAFSAGGPALQQKASRALQHREMVEVCKSYRTWSPASKLAELVTERPGPDLLTVADAFVALQEGRERADYDLSSVFTHQEGFELVQRASRAHAAFARIEGTPEAQVFLAGLLLAKRWSRGGG